jgi:hypothetical protein
MSTKRCSGREARHAVVTVLAAGALLVAASDASTAVTVLPDPCQLVPSALVASAFGTRHAPASSSTAVTNASTCSYKAGQLTVSIGYTALTNPAAPAKVTKVGGLPAGQYETYAGTKASQLTFIKGAAANGIYVVIRNYGRIPLKKLVKIAKAVNAGLAGGGSSTGTLIP